MLLSCHVRVSRVNLHSIVCLNVKELHIWTKYLKFKWQQQVSNPVRKRTNWPVLLHGWVFVYEMSGCGFEFRCYHFNLNHLPPFKYKLISVKSTCKLSVCISKNLRWWNEEQAKSTKIWHTMSFTSLQFSSVIQMLGLPLLFTYLTLSKQLRRQIFMQGRILDVARGVGQGGRASLFFATTCFFAITLKNYKLCYLK